MAKKSTRKKKRSGGNGSAIVFCCIALIVIAVVIFIGCVYISNDAQGTILEGVYVAGVDVGGMTQVQAREAVSAAADSYTQNDMTVTVLNDRITISPETSGARLDIKAAVKAAYKYGHSGSTATKQEQQDYALNYGYNVDLSNYLNLDADAIKAALNELGAIYSSTLSQSTWEVSGTAPDQTLVITLGIPEYGLDMDKLYQSVLDAYSANSFSVTGECGMIEPDAVDLDTIWAQYYVAPVDAHFDEDTFEIIPGTEGYGFDLESAKAQLSSAAYGSKVEIPLGAVQPEVTADTLAGTLYRDTLATYTAEYGSESNRDTNLSLACQAIDGLVIYPGETFSYNRALGERTEEKGYKPGPSYYNGKTVDTIGGGICQVSSCLYYCALTADLEITARTNHGYTVSYMPLGMDAAVSWGSLDLCFRNTTSYPIRIEASASGGNTTVTLLGTDEKDYYVKMEYEVLSTDAYSTTYQTMPADNAEGYRDGDYIIEPHTGYSIQTYRCKYKKDTDELISKEKEATSKYDTCDAVVCLIQSQSTPAPTTPGIGNGGVTDEDGLLPP